MKDALMKLESNEPGIVGSNNASAAWTGPLPTLTAVQWVICSVAGLGFAFDLYESLMTALIVGPVLTTLGHLKAGTSEFNLWVGLFFFLPAVTGGIFGLFGGYLTDLLGRRRVLVWSILLYGFSACAASFANSLPILLVLRCTTMIGVCVEAIAAIAWLAELFPIAKQREAVLGYTQACYALGGLMVSGAYYLAVTYGERLPAIFGSHQPWRYTLLSGLIPAIPLMAVRPFLPESPIWRLRKSEGTLKRPSLAELFQPRMRQTTLLATLMMACTFAVPYGALQHTPRIVPGLVEKNHLPPQQVQKAVSTVFLVQESGSITGRLVFALLVTQIVGRRRLFLIFLGPALVVFPWLFFLVATDGLLLFKLGVFCAQALFNGLHSFWGNYLPRLYPTHLRGTGESFAMNIGGRVMGVSAALLTTQLSNVMPGTGAASRLAHSAGITAALVLVIAFLASFWLPEPRSSQLPE
jgi:predicted MFS family arabinose efflux permease